MNHYQLKNIPSLISFDFNKGHEGRVLILNPGESGSESEWSAVNQPEKEFLDEMVNSFDILTEGDSSAVKSRKWGVIADLYGQLGIHTLFGFEFEGFEICNPYSSENGMDLVADPAKYYGKPYEDWLLRFEHGVKTFPWPMPEGFEDCSYKNDSAPSIMSNEKDIQIFVAEADKEERELPEFPRFVVIKASEYGMSSLDMFSTESFVDLLGFLENMEQRHVMGPGF